MTWQKTLRGWLTLKPLRHPAPAVAVLRLAGAITPLGGPFRSTLSLAGLAAQLQQAFALRGLKAVALAVNSPGGSAVQSALIAERIRALAAEKGVPVLSFVEDVAASGGYWIALAGDEIYVNPSSIVGSIGVISGGFGFQELMAKIGVERRLHTSGDRKSFLDPFKPEDEADVKRLTALQKEIHAAFRAHVESRRQGKLKGGPRTLFSGEIWTGAKAVELGLADGLGDLRGVLRQRYGPEVKLRPIQPRPGFLKRRLGLVPGGRSAVDDLVSGAFAALEERALWARYGL